MLTLIIHSWSGSGAADREAVTGPAPITAFSDVVCICSVSALAQIYAIARGATSSRRRAWTYSDDNGLLAGYFWMTVEWQEAQLYRKLGRPSEAKRIEAELLKRLAHADPDHPLLVRLRRGGS